MNWQEQVLFKFDNIRNFFVHQEFWCNICDYNQVDSDKPESGHWFQVGGHVRQKATLKSLKGQDKSRHDSDDTGDYENVIFAVCMECYNKKEEPKKVSEEVDVH